METPPVAERDPLAAGSTACRRQRLLGVLDVQSDRVGYFKDKDDVRVYTTLAGRSPIGAAEHNLYAEQAATVARIAGSSTISNPAFLATHEPRAAHAVNSIIGFTDGVILGGLDGPTSQMETDLGVVQKNGGICSNSSTTSSTWPRSGPGR